MVSVGVNGREPYEQHARDLKAEVDALGVENDIHIGQYPWGSPRHQECSHAFKWFAVWPHWKAGRRVLWLDAARGLRDVRPLQDVLSRDGYFMHHDNWNCGQWCSDRAAAMFNLTRDELFTIPMIESGHMAFDFSRSECAELWRRVGEYLPAFHGPVRNDHGEASADPRVGGHRHDQLVISIVAHQLGMTTTANCDDFLFRPNEHKPEACIRWGIKP